MIIKFNALGVVVQTITNDEPLRQGNIGNHLVAEFVGRNNVNYTATFAFTRSDGTYIAEVAMSPDASDVTKFNYTFDDPWFFALSGETTCSVKLVNSAGVAVVSGQITFNIEKTDFTGDDPQITVTQLAALQALIASKLNTQSGIVVVANKNSVVVSEYQEGQMFYVTSEDSFYKLQSSSLVLNSNIAVIVNPTLTVGSVLPIEKLSRPVCFIIYSNVVYKKDRVDGDNLLFVNDYRINSGGNSQYDTFGRVEYRFNKVTGALVSYTVATKQVYNKPQIDEQFYNKNESDQKFVAKKTTSGQQVYGHNGSIENEIKVSPNAEANTIAQRNADGTLTVETPTSDSDASTKGYTDALGNTKVTKTTSGYKIYATDELGNPVLLPYDEDTEGKVVRRDESGHVYVQRPNANGQAVPKQYADEFAKALIATINNTTYVMTLTLKDGNGNTVGTPQTIDLPLESIVVSAVYYDSYTYGGTTYSKVIVITLATTDVPTIVPVGDLVSGLVSTDQLNTALNNYYTKTESDNKYVPKTTTIAGVNLQDNITEQEMLTALGLEFTDVTIEEVN